jgi:hypothetical protein
MVHPAESDEEEMESEEENEEENEEKSDEEKSDNETVEEEETDIWADIANHVNQNNEEPLAVYKQFVMQAHTLQIDCVHKKVMKTLKRYQEDDDMDFEEALDKTIQKRKYLILREIARNESDDEEENVAVNT